LLFVWRIGK